MLGNIFHNVTKKMNEWFIPKQEKIAKDLLTSSMDNTCYEINSIIESDRAARKRLASTISNLLG